MYNELYEIWVKEKETLHVQHLPKNFYTKIASYIKKIKEENRMLDKKTTKAKLLDYEFNNVKLMIEELFILRFRKIQQSSLSGGAVARDVLTLEEEKLFLEVFSLTEAYHDFSRNIIRGNSSKIEKSEKPKMKVLRFVKEIPALMGSDMKTYGPFWPEDIATLPSENARILIKQGVAVEVDSN